MLPAYLVTSLCRPDWSSSWAPCSHFWNLNHSNERANRVELVAQSPESVPFSVLLSWNGQNENHLAWTLIKFCSGRRFPLDCPFPSPLWGLTLPGVCCVSLTVAGTKDTEWSLLAFPPSSSKELLPSWLRKRCSLGTPSDLLGVHLGHTSHAAQPGSGDRGSPTYVLCGFYETSPSWTSFYWLMPCFSFPSPNWGSVLSLHQKHKQGEMGFMFLFNHSLGLIIAWTFWKPKLSLGCGLDLQCSLQFFCSWKVMGP